MLSLRSHLVRAGRSPCSGGWPGKSPFLCPRGKVSLRPHREEACYQVLRHSRPCLHFSLVTGPALSHRVSPAPLPSPESALPSACPAGCAHAAALQGKRHRPDTKSLCAGPRPGLSVWSRCRKACFLSCNPGVITAPQLQRGGNEGERENAYERPS